MIGRAATGIGQLMINSKRVIAIIPARGGSKGLPGKNIRPLLGKPLINWSIECAQSSRFVDQICVTTESEEIAAVSMDAGVEVPFLRPAYLADDTATSFSVVTHAIDFYRNLGSEFEYLVLLEPTSPIRKNTDIDTMLQKLEDRCNDFDAIITVGIPSTHPYLMQRIVGDLLEPFLPSVPMGLRRQDYERVYFPYGVAYICKTQVLIDECTFYPQRSTHHLIDRYQCFDIDDIHDFICVEQVMRHEGMG